jgi:hypothetical protein
MKLEGIYKSAQLQKQDKLHTSQKLTNHQHFKTQVQVAER